MAGALEAGIGRENAGGGAGGESGCRSRGRGDRIRQSMYDSRGSSCGYISAGRTPG
jgi:hypothetical protein